MDFSAITVLCIGDVMLDRFLYGEMERISPEAPVPVLLLKERREMPGGAGNVVSNVISLGGKAVLVGLVGNDDAATTLRDRLRHGEQITDALVTTAHRPTICKTRYIATHQQVVRADEESRLPLQPEEAEALQRAIDVRLTEADVVILSDYGKGVCDPLVVRHLMEGARNRGVPVFVDPKSSDFSRYHGATCITPNARELAAAAGANAGDDAEVEAAARLVMAQAGAKAILATRSEKGMMLVPRDGQAVGAPARAREVFDVSGAGDTVIATMALAVASGMPWEQAMRVANAAAGVVVGKLGTATADIAEVLGELRAQDMSSPVGHLLSQEQAARQVVRWKEQGLTVGFTNGCFDILHPGHISLLAAARAECDRLIVALNDDASVRRLKGETRPINALTDRAIVIAALRSVDAVVSFAEDTPLEIIRKLMPDVLVKGADYTPEQVVGAGDVIAAGGRLVLVDLRAGHSTTATVRRIAGD
ncbi:bifunctional D-glycero-beta-D-manno-heptose-7-phosphate kinase/D-glycero-beta-D-manno-heptose 1-phosphate adenylyltransferase HldE [Acetobacter sp. DsW_063]|uniref:bifunctional D-glycero-beta-D-manno-heptose-7-phosphate kinase/D-glycero-beta-D-manno-heptose 1-phosphate adenylyltransferase HldE n=1 Tax=Acetobacter sp. DsW_063 TaxID=1514894 RepID=UPI000A3649F5|nr:bifunctional D-glycero-beta-D-manno-heptose-7-phosphate kinase/D-glycero-beta-D-manno-heptose 1-phosphate adenylyltransferase HldE [Acetobacter sp. DsW_063]OUJ16879.1 D-beta-D-heptose 1-phosphate adenosyltransferase [Acetobacter sp. DsW_063]